jgi:hypothetical protein
MRRRQKLKSKTIAVIGLTIVGLVAVNVFGIPRFAARVEQKCNLCHISPNGGGMRNSFGSQFYAQTELAAHKVPLDKIGEFEPQVSKSISLGTDLRTVYHFDNNIKQSTFFQMEGNFYASAQLDERFSATLNKGLYSGFEAYGLGYLFPLNGYFKVGKFQPPYGWYFDDHTMFVREKLLWPPNSYDTGIEVGIMPEHLSVSLGTFNGTPGILDDDKRKAISGRFELREHVSFLGYGLGGSYYLNSKKSGDISMYGPFANFSIGNFIYTGELDWLKYKMPAIDSVLARDSISFATSHELAYSISRGIWLRIQYDYLKPDKNTKIGTLSRFGFGIQYFPIGFIEVSPLFRFYDQTQASGKHNRYFVFDGLIHFFF